MNRRISLVTAAAVAGTVLAGSAAIAANIGVLSAAEDDSIGNLSADASVASPAVNDESQVVDIYIEDPAVPSAETSTTTTTTATPDVESGVTTQEFAVEGAGTVTVTQDDLGVRVTQVDARAGWLWKTEQSTPTGLVVTFASNDTIYEFHASVDDNGVLDARVDQPIVNVIQRPGPAPSGGAATPAAPSTAPVTAPGYDDDDEDDDHDDYDDYDDDEDDDHDDHDEDDDDEDDDHDDDHEGSDDDD